MKLTPERKAEVLTVHLRRNLGQGDMGSEVTRLQEALVGYGELAEKNVTGCVATPCPTCGVAGSGFTCRR
eukprot:scaffold2755_cov333-Prasinococcus_capsulatus_cf.AAC.6